MRSREPFRLGLVQMRCCEDSAENLARACAFLREAADRGAHIACLPELFRTPYFCQVEDASLFNLAETIPGPTTDCLADLARQLRMVIVGSVFEKRAAGLYHNTAVVLDSGGSLLGIYRKMHIPDDPLFYEKYYFTPGDLGFRSFQTAAANVGTLVCWDQWYPEAARITSLLGAEILLYPTAIGWHPSEKTQFGAVQYDSWRTIQRSHAVANGIYVAAVNRIGHEGPSGGGLEFWGGSFLADPSGTIIVQSGHDNEEVLIADCDPARIEETRRNWPFLRDRRIDAYAPLARRFID